MLGNIDAYVIAYSYLTPTQIPTGMGPKVSEILENYYLGIQNYYSINGLSLFQNKRYSIFASRIGLLWQPSTQMFINSELPYEEYSKQTGMSGALFVGAGVASSDLIRAGIFARKIRSSTFRYELVKLFFKNLRQAIIDQ